MSGCTCKRERVKDELIEYSIHLLSHYNNSYHYVHMLKLKVAQAESVLLNAYTSTHCILYMQTHQIRLYTVPVQDVSVSQLYSH